MPVFRNLLTPNIIGTVLCGGRKPCRRRTRGNRAGWRLQAGWMPLQRGVWMPLVMHCRNPLRRRTSISLLEQPWGLGAGMNDDGELLVRSGPVFIDFEASSWSKRSWLIEVGLAWIETGQVIVESKLIRGQPGVLVTDKLRSYGAAKAQIAPGIEHHQHNGLNNRTEASHRHTRRREKSLGRFKSPRQAQQFLSAHDQAASLLRPKRHRLSAVSCRRARHDAFSLWAGYSAELAA